MSPAPRRTSSGRRRSSDDARAASGRAVQLGASSEEQPEPGTPVERTVAELESDARAIALRQLTGAPRSRHQLAQAMARRDIPDDVAERVLDRFVEVDLIDDAEYAKMLVRSQRDSRGLARRALAAELRRKGIGPHEASDALAEVDDDDEETTARELLRRRWRARPGVDPAVQARRALGMLARKGYPPGLSARLVREMVDDTGDEPWDTVDAETD